MICSVIRRECALCDMRSGAELGSGVLAPRGIDSTRLKISWSLSVRYYECELSLFLFRACVAIPP